MSFFRNKLSNTTRPKILRVLNFRPQFFLLLDKKYIKNIKHQKHIKNNILKILKYEDFFFEKGMA